MSLSATKTDDVAFIPPPDTASSIPLRHGPQSIGVLADLLLASWLFPGRAARRSLNVSLLVCWLLHFGAGVLGAMLIAATFISIDQSPGQVIREINSLRWEWTQYPIAITLAAMGIAVLIELGHLALAFILSAWGGLAGERLRDSLRHALKQVWLRTPHALLIVFILGLLVLALDKAGQRWRQVHPHPWTTVTLPTWPTPPTIPQSDPNFAAAQRKYRKELLDFQSKSRERARVWREWEQTQPWYLRYDEPIAIAAGCLTTVWWLAALLRAVGIRRETANQQCPPLCLWCGYNLSTIPLESRCPECGQAVVNSLGDGAQPGAAWETHRSVGKLAAWRQTWREAVRDPIAFGRSLRLDEPGTDHRLFLLLHLVAIFFVGVAGLTAGVAHSANPGQQPPGWAIVLLAVFVFGLACTLGALLVACFSASLVGWIISLRAKRNLFPASMQVAAYTMPFLVAWTFFGAVIVNCVIHLNMNGLFVIAQEATGLHADALSFFFVFLSNLTCGLIYLWIIARATNAARFANR